MVYCRLAKFSAHFKMNSNIIELDLLRPLYTEIMKVNLLNKLLFHNIPLGATGERIPQAAVASAQTSQELVKREDEDSAFFAGWKKAASYSTVRRFLRYGIIKGRF